MKVLLRELEIDLPVALDRPNALTELREAAEFLLPPTFVPLRFAITKSNGGCVRCAISTLEGSLKPSGSEDSSIFEFASRKCEHSNRFNVAFLIPTGIGAEIGGHAGDATPAARLIAETCDTLILHPNVVNASDINEMPTNSLYVEGSVISRLLMGTVGIAPTRANRVLVIIDAHEDSLFVNATINAVSAARASYGLVCPEVIQLSPPVMMTAEYTDSGTAAGKISGLERVLHGARRAKRRIRCGRYILGGLSSQGSSTKDISMPQERWSILGVESRPCLPMPCRADSMYPRRIHQCSSLGRSQI